MIRVGRDVSNAKLLELTPTDTIMRMISIRLMKSPFNKPKPYDYKNHKTGEGFCSASCSHLSMAQNRGGGMCFLRRLVIIECEVIRKWAVAQKQDQDGCKRLYVHARWRPLRRAETKRRDRNGEEEQKGRHEEAVW